jgi:hypothetical protein
MATAKPHDHWRDLGGRVFDAAGIALSHNSDATVKLKYAGKTHKSVRVRLGRPLFRRDEFASVLTPKGAEVGIIINLPRMRASAMRVLEEHRVMHDLTCRIFRVRALSHQFGASFWTAETTKGLRQFVIRGTTEHIRWLTDDRMLITDVHGNRFEIRSLKGLDKKSQDFIHLIT